MACQGRRLHICAAILVNVPLTIFPVNEIHRLIIIFDECCIEHVI